MASIRHLPEFDRALVVHLVNYVRLLHRLKSRAFDLMTVFHGTPRY